MVKFKLWEKLGGSMDPTGMESLGGGRVSGAKGGGSVNLIQPVHPCMAVVDVTGSKTAQPTENLKWLQLEIC